MSATHQFLARKTCMILNQPCGAVAAGHQATADAAAEILRAGGNAFDATIAAAFMACVAEPVLASCGGGGFATVRTATGDTEVFDFFVQTPRTKTTGVVDFREAHADFGPATQKFHIGPGATATPGFVPGLFALHQTHASLPMTQLLGPAIKMARQGVRVTAFQAYLFGVVAPILTASRQVAALFAPGGTMLAEGETLVNSGLADFFELLPIDGLAAYDKGAIHTALLEAQSHGGHLRAADFQNYRVERRKPLKIEFGGAKICTNPLPAAGGVLIGHTLASLEGAEPLAMALALETTDDARRKSGGDLDQLLKNQGQAAYRGTTHISVIDSASNACAMTISNGEGNGQIVGDFGFMLNNMLGEEDVNPAGALGWDSDRRLSSMMSPMLAETADGTILALGSGGSNRIRSAIVQVLAKILAGNNLDSAIAAPRLHVEDNHLDFEAGFAPVDQQALIKNFPDHRRWDKSNMFFGGCQIVSRKGDGELTAFGDARRAGTGLNV